MTGNIEGILAGNFFVFPVILFGQGGLVCIPSKATLAIDWPVYAPRGWGMPGRSRPLPKPWFGLDTERDARTGEFVCGWIVGEMTERFQRITDLQSGTYWVWNLAYDIEGMLRDLDLEEAWAARRDGASFELLGGPACYYHGKRFDWKFEGRKLSFIEASSFFGRRPLWQIGAKENVDASTMSLERYRTEPEYQANVDSYCRQDARIVYENITKLSGGLESMGVNIGATPGATARRFLSQLGPFPTLLWRTHKNFLRSYCGGRFEITKRGVLHDVRQYDIVSAYPWALANCPWLTENARERHSIRFSDDALYGTYEVRFKYDNYLGVAPRWKNGIRVYSSAQERTWLARPEVDWLLKRGVDVKIIRGVEVFDEAATGLWGDVIHRLFKMKQEGKKESHGGWGAKIILNSQYGILIQLVRRSGKWVDLLDAKNPVDFAGTLALEEPPKEFEGGKYFAPLYAGNLTALTRCKLLDAAEIAGENYIGGHTDSVLIGNGGRLPNLGTGLGDWEMKNEVPRADICKTGMYALGEEIKIRGITRRGTAQMLWQDTFVRRSRIGIKSANDWSKVSLIVPKTVANNFAAEQKRNWFGDVTRGLIALERHVDSEALANVV